MVLDMHDAHQQTHPASPFPSPEVDLHRLVAPQRQKGSHAKYIFYVARLQGAQAVGSPDLRLATVLPKAPSPR